jgi:hypothetical protein
MEIEPTSSREIPLRVRPLASSIDLPRPSRCPCGQESLDTLRGLHVIGPSCREKVERHVRRRFGAHRYGGRYAAEVPDMIQDCYQKLLAPGGLASFEPAPGRETGDAFGGWLWRVVHNHCNNKLQYLLAQPAVGGDELDDLPESRDAITPDQAFARARIRELGEGAVAELAPSWQAKGPVWSERLDVILQLVCEKEADTERARERLDITDGHLRQLKLKLTRSIRCEWRKQIRDGLVLEAGLEPEVIELMIDREIEALFQAAYPGSGAFASLASEPEPEPTDEQPESKP